MFFEKRSHCSRYRYVPRREQGGKCSNAALTWEAKPFRNSLAKPSNPVVFFHLFPSEILVDRFNLGLIVLESRSVWDIG